MTSIDIETILTIVYVVIDDWYQQVGQQMQKGKVGRKPRFSDSEVMTLMLAADFIPYPGEKQYMGYIRANYRKLFPDVISQSQYNRRARQLRGMAEALRRSWLVELGVDQQDMFLLDTKPIPVIGYKRWKARSDFWGHAAYGYCASRNMNYFGYKLVMVTTLDGLPVVYELVPANTDERAAADTVLDQLRNATIIGDKGFIGAEWQTQIHEKTGNVILTPFRKNQKVKLSKRVERLLNTVRERIEGAFHELQNTGGHLEHLRARTVVGLVSRVVAKVTAHLLRRILAQRFTIDIQSFQWAADAAF